MTDTTTLAPSFPGRRLALFYFVFFAGVGVFMPYWSLYLKSIGMDAATIGWIMALMMAIRIITPNIWGWIADRRGQHLGVIRFGACSAFVVFILVPFTKTALLLALVMVVHGIFWTAVLPQFEAVTLAHLGTRSERYSQIRLWGSVGFVVASAVVGWLLERTGTLAMPWFMLLLIGAVAVISFFVTEPAATTIKTRDTIKVVAAAPIRAMVCLLLACALMQASHGPYYVFFSIYLADHGYSAGEIGALWSLGVAAEVVLFALMPRLLARVTPMPLFVACFALTALRWAALAWLPVSLPLLISVQLLHAVSFGAYHAVAIALLHRLFAHGLQGRGQALYSSLSFGVGGAVGSVAAGWLWVNVGSGGAWLAAAVIAGLGAVAALGTNSALTSSRHNG